MSTGLYSHTSRAAGTILTASIYNADHLNHVTNQNPLMTGAYSDDVTQMRSTASPGGIGTEVLAGSLAGELERLRFVLKQMKGTNQWYETGTGIQLQGFTLAGLPAAGTAGRLARVTDDVRGPWEDTGEAWVPSFGRIAYVNRFAGADLGARINAADTTLGTSPGEIWVDRRLSSTVSTAVTIKSGHTLRFIQGGQYVFTAGITLEQGASIIGSGGVAINSSTSTGTILAHNFNGDFLTYSGASTGIGSQGGGALENLTLWNTFTGGDLNGNAIKITGTVVNTNQSSFILVRRVFVDGASATNRWTRGLLADGTPIGGTDGIRNIWIEDSRFNNSGTDFEDVKLLNVFNPHLNNVTTSNSNNGAQQIGITVSGIAGAISSNVFLTDVDTGRLVLDWAQNVHVLGGAYTSITNTVNATGTNFLFPALLVTVPFVNNAPTNTFAAYYDVGNNALRFSGHVLLQNAKYLQGLTAAGVAKNLLGIDSGNRLNLDLNDVGVTIGSALTEAVRSGQFIHPVIPTASLPAAGAANDGRILIESAAANVENFIIYANGRRWRITGTSF